MVTAQQGHIPVRSPPNKCCLCNLAIVLVPVLRLQCIHGVVIHEVQLLLSEPVKESHRHDLEEDVDETRIVLHVHWQSVVGHLADNPGPTTGADIHLRQGSGKGRLSSEPKWQQLVAEPS